MNGSHLELAIKEALDKRANVISIELGISRFVFSHVLFQTDKTHSGNFRFLHAEEVQDAVMVLFISIDGNEQKLYKRHEAVWLAINKI